MRRTPVRRLAAILVALSALLAAGAPAAASAAAGGGDPFNVTIRRTSHGIPHVLARDYAGLGYGYGYAFAQDNLCQIADSYVTVRAQRSRYFGPDASWAFRANSTNPNNLNSDFFFQKIINDGTIEALLAKSAPEGPRPEVRQIVHGYVAGYNRYLADTGVDHLPDPTCRGKPWVQPIHDIDAYRRFYELALLASQGVAIDGIGGAAPLAGPASLTGASRSTMIEQLKARLPLGGIGSNAVALGAQATDNGRGMLLGNPHFPWDGAERFYQAQLTIPGKLDVSGASLYGVPLVLIGYTRDMAWSHTVSTAYRFTPFEERLVPGSPTTYLVDGQPRQMTAHHVTVQVRNADGSITPRSRTLYSTSHGSIFTSLLGIPLPWTATSAYAMGDANAPNFRYLNHFFETDRAHSAVELDHVLRRNQGIPWVNTIAADSHGRAYYADLSVVPNVPDAKAKDCDTALGAATYAALRLPVLDGSRSSCNWDNDPDAIQPGIFGPRHLPSLFRHDYVTNSNDSYWLANPNQHLTGYAPIVGDERTARSLRTRSGLVMVAERLAHGRFSLADLQHMVFSDRQYAGELLRDQLVAMCEANPVMLGSSGPVDVSAACPVLRAWDLHDDLRSRGAVLFRRFASRALASVGGVLSNPTVFATPFDANDPVHTPRDLNTSSPQVRQALADAVTDLRSNGIPLDAPLLGYQYEMRGSEKIPIHGGPGTLGVFNAINVTWTPPAGYPDVPHGSSYVQAVQFGGGACPHARTILTYSQSINPHSPYFADQTRMFSHKQWVDPPFCEDAIRADPAFSAMELGAPRSCAKNEAVSEDVVRPAGQRAVSVDAYVGDVRLKRFTGRDLTRVTLTGLPRGAFTLTLVTHTDGGRGIVTTHRFGACPS